MRCQKISVPDSAKETTMDRDRATEQAKAIVEEAWRQTCAGPGEFDDYAVTLIADALRSKPHQTTDEVKLREMQRRQRR